MPMRLLITIFMMSLSILTAFAQSGEGNGRIVLGEEIQPKDTTKNYRFKNRLIAPKGDWQCGLSVMYADFSSADSDYMMLLQGLNAKASMLRLAPEAAYTYMSNHAVGARFQYTNLDGMIDSATADLLGNFSMTVENIHATSRSMSGAVFHRTYVGLDKNGRVGIFWDYTLGYTRNKTQFNTGGPASYTINNKFLLGFMPGIVYFPMNNVSIQACLSLAEVSYNNVKAYETGVVVGRRQAWKAQASLNVLNLSFGLTIHL